MLVEIVMGAFGYSHQIIFISTGYKKKFELCFGFLWIWEQRFRRFGIWSRRKASYPCKFIHIAQAKIKRLSSSHRKSCDSSVLPIFQRWIVLLDVWDQIIKQIPFEAGKGRYFVRSKDIACCSVIGHGTSIGHHHNHRLKFLISIQVVENNLRIGTIQPFLFVATYTMQ